VESQRTLRLADWAWSYPAKVARAFRSVFDVFRAAAGGFMLGGEKSARKLPQEFGARRLFGRYCTEKGVTPARWLLLGFFLKTP
jgi:hypothetical protein